MHDNVELMCTNKIDIFLLGCCTKFSCTKIIKGYSQLTKVTIPPSTPLLLYQRTDQLIRYILVTKNDEISTYFISITNNQCQIVFYYKNKHSYNSLLYTHYFWKRSFSIIRVGFYVCLLRKAFIINLDILEFSNFNFGLWFL